MIYKIVEINKADGFYGQNDLIGRIGTIEDMFNAPGYPGWKAGFFTLDSNGKKMFFRAIKVVPLTGIEKEKEMEITVNGVELKGDNVFVEAMLKSLGISLKTYRSGSTGKILVIRDMDTNHIKNALIKKLRDEEVEVGWQDIDLWELLRAFGGSIPEETLLEMSGDEFIGFFNLFVSELNNDEFTNLLNELKGRDF